MAKGYFSIGLGVGVGAATAVNKIPSNKVDKPKLKPGKIATSAPMPDCTTTVKDIKFKMSISGIAAVGAIGMQAIFPLAKYSAADGVSLTINEGPTLNVVVGAGASLNVTGSGEVSGTYTFGKINSF